MVFKVADQSRENTSCLIQQAGNVVVHENAAIDDTVQHVFDGPSQLTHNQRTDHAAAAF